MLHILLLVLLAVVAFLFWYAFGGKTWLRGHCARCDRFLTFMEEKVYRNSRTILIARFFYTIPGYLLTGYEALNQGLLALSAMGLDVSSLASSFLPSPWGFLLGIAWAATGHIFTKMRTVSDKPVTGKQAPADA